MAMTATETRTTCGEALIALLEQHGVEVVFGIPGVHTLELYRGLVASGIRHITPRHEQGAAFMAAGYARVARRPGVCTLITGPGVTNAATAVASAYHDSQPVLIISSATDTRQAGRGRGALHDLPDQQAFMSTITAFSETLGSAADLPGAVDRAFAVLDGPRPRPVHLGIPTDVLEQAAAGAPAAAPVAAPGPLPVDGAALDDAAHRLAAAERPIIMLGGGAIDAGPEALRISAAIGAPIATTINGKGAVPETDPAALGATLALDPVYTAVKTADVVLAVGTELSEVDYGYQPIPRFAGDMIRVDCDPAQLANGHEPAVAIAGDAAAVLGQLADRLDGASAEAPTSVVPDGAGVAARRAADLRSRLVWWEGGERFLPLLDTIAASLPEDAIVVADSTQIAYVGNCYLPTARPRSYLAPAGFGTLGPALPMALGAKVAAPHRPVVCLVGDGGMLFTVAELATAAAHGLPVVVLLFNNAGYGEIRDSLSRAGIPDIGTDGTAANYLKLAEGLGCAAARVGSLGELGSALSAALGAGRPTVLEMPGELAQ
jgi:acetolactate synthase I/II/III large subunit